MGRGQIRVHPVAALGTGGTLLSSPVDGVPDDAWLRSGPTVPLRLEMRLYRWCLTFGEIVLNWEDLTAVTPVSKKCGMEGRRDGKAL